MNEGMITQPLPTCERGFEMITRGMRRKDATQRLTDEASTFRDPDLILLTQTVLNPSSDLME